jgi:hypothetical protein
VDGLSDGLDRRQPGILRADRRDRLAALLASNDTIDEDSELAPLFTQGPKSSTSNTCATMCSSLTPGARHSLADQKHTAAAASEDGQEIRAMRSIRSMTLPSS